MTGGRFRNSGVSSRGAIDPCRNEFDTPFSATLGPNDLANDRSLGVLVPQADVQRAVRKFVTRFFVRALDHTSQSTAQKDAGSMRSPGRQFEWIHWQRTPDLSEISSLVN